MSRRTLTFLFTDVESSTQRWQEDREAMAEALAAHDRLLARVVDANGGRVFKHTGDGVCAVFDSASGAVTAAVEAQGSLGLPVRMGLHTGEAQERGGDFYGPTLNRCARIMDAGHGGQVLVSAVTRSLLDGVEMVDLGEYCVKGIGDPERIYQIGSTDFPALRVGGLPTALPSVVSSLVGRDELVATVVERLVSAGLVTLVGVGGVGKTRLAIAAAERAMGGFDVTVFVDLSEVDGDGEVLSAFARSLGVQSPTLDAVGIVLGDRTVLVVLDNCEHVLDGAAELVEELRELSPSVRVLATSREGLAVDGEHLVAVPGLSAAPDDSAAVALFVDRARSVDATFVMRAEDVGAVAELCGRLDGLPLAIELAAARVGVMSVADLLARLDARFDVLTGGRGRRRRSRSRTLRETVDWSYELLDEAERRALARLSVFAGSFDLNGASAVLDEPREVVVLDLVEALVDKSLLTVIDVEERRRYRFLETVRLYAEQRLAQAGDTDTVMALLHEHLAAVVATAVDEMFRSPVDNVRLRVEIPNLRRAFDDAIARHDAAAAAALIAAFADLAPRIDWPINGWAQIALALPEARGSSCESQLLALDAVDRLLRNEVGGLHARADELLRLADSTGPSHFGVVVVAVLMYAMTGDDEAAVRTSRDLAEWAEPDRAIVCRLMAHWIELVPSDPTAEIRISQGFDTDLAAAREHPSRVVRTIAASVDAVHAHATGDPHRMRDMARRAADLDVVGSPTWFMAHQIRAFAAYELGELRDSIAIADQALDHAHRYGDRSAMILPLTTYALVLQAFGEVEAAATVRGGLPRRLTKLMASQLVDLDRHLDHELDPERRTELAARGRTLNPRALQQLCHSTLAEHLQSAPENDRPNPANRRAHDG